MSYVIFFVEMILYTLFAVVACGLLVGFCERLFVGMLGQGMGRGVVIGTSLIGTPVHEWSHALMCVIFGHKIQKIVLWQPCSEDGTLGYVTHSFNTRNVYQRLGNLFIGVGPVFGGMGVLLLCMLWGFPQTIHAYFDAVGGMIGAGNGGIGAILLEGVYMIPHMIEEFSSDAVPVWGRIIALVVMLSVSLHINLSLSDIKGALSAVPLYLLLLVVPTVIISLIGTDAMTTVRYGLQTFNATMIALFTIVFVFVLIQLLLAFVVSVLRRVFGRR